MTTPFVMVVTTFVMVVTTLSPVFQKAFESVVQVLSLSGCATNSSSVEGNCSKGC